MVTAILAIEDYHFYQHGALDLKGTLRALITNQASNGVVHLVDRYEAPVSWYTGKRFGE